MTTVGVRPFFIRTSNGSGTTQDTLYTRRKHSRGAQEVWSALSRSSPVRYARGSILYLQPRELQNVRSNSDPADIGLQCVLCVLTSYFKQEDTQHTVCLAGSSLRQSLHCAQILLIALYKRPYSYCRYQSSQQHLALPSLSHECLSTVVASMYGASSALLGLLERVSFPFEEGSLTSSASFFLAHCALSESPTTLLLLLSCPIQTQKCTRYYSRECKT